MVIVETWAEVPCGCLFSDRRNAILRGRCLGHRDLLYRAAAAGLCDPSGSMLSRDDDFGPFSLGDLNGGPR